MLVLDDDAAYERAWDYKDHGKSLRRSAIRVHGSRNVLPLARGQLRNQLRMDEMSAALGRIGLRQLPEWHRVRTHNARRLAAGVACLPGLRVRSPQMR